MPKRIIKTEHCTNCNTFQGDANFCPNCGQPNNSRKPNAWELVVEAVENLFAFDSKFYRSLPPLLWKPGKMPSEIIHGKRSKYVPPLRLFILMTFLMLFALSCEQSMSKEHWYDITPPSANDEGGIVNFSIDSANIEPHRIDSLLLTGDLYIDSASNKLYVSQKSSFRDTLITELGNAYIDKLHDHAILNPEQNVDEALHELGLSPTFWNHLFYSNVHKVTQMTAEEFGKYLRGNLLIILLMFIPVMALMLKVLYLNQSVYFVDHFIFAIQGQTTLFAYITIVELITIALSAFTSLSDILYVIMALMFIVYIFIAMKRFYGENRLLTTVKFAAMNLGLVFVSLIFIFLVATVSVILY